MGKIMYLLRTMTVETAVSSTAYLIHTNAVVEERDSRTNYQEKKSLEKNWLLKLTRDIQHYQKLVQFYALYCLFCLFYNFQ